MSSAGSLHLARLTSNSIFPARLVMSSPSKASLHVKLGTLLGLEPASNGVALRVELTDEVIKEVQETIVRTPPRPNLPRPQAELPLTGPTSYSLS